MNIAIMVAVLIKRTASRSYKTQKHDIFVRITIMIAILINSAFYEDCDHGRNPIKTQKHGIFVRTTIMVAVLIKT